MVKHGKTVCAIVHHIIFQCGWLNGPIFSRGSSWPMMYVVWASFKNYYYVDL